MGKKYRVMTLDDDTTAVVGPDDRPLWESHGGTRFTRMMLCEAIAQEWNENGTPQVIAQRLRVAE